MKLLVATYKRSRLRASSPTGYATDGGFPIQMDALAELFDATTILMEADAAAAAQGDVDLQGHGLRVVPLPGPGSVAGSRKLGLLPWTLARLPRLIRELRAHDAVHTPIPCDTGSIVMLLAWLMRKPLFVRHCGNWHATRTTAERFWKWFMTRHAGGRNVMLATGGGDRPPEPGSPDVGWIFSTTLRREEILDPEVPREFPRSELRLITTGRQEPGKGTDIVIDALPALREQGWNLVLHVVGEGSALPALQARAASSGMAANVVFHGRVHHGRVMQLLSSSHLFCFPSASEGFPKAVLEAMACGLPVVASAVSVLPSLLRDGGGVALEERSPRAVANAVRACCSSAGAYTSMSRAARRTARRYSLEAWSSALSSILSERWGTLRTDGTAAP